MFCFPRNLAVFNRTLWHVETVLRDIKSVLQLICIAGNVWLQIVYRRGSHQVAGNCLGFLESLVFQCGAQAAHISVDNALPQGKVFQAQKRVSSVLWLFVQNRSPPRHRFRVERNPNRIDSPHFPTSYQHSMDWIPNVRNVHQKHEFFSATLCTDNVMFVDFGVLLKEHGGFPLKTTCPELPDEDDYMQLLPRVFDGADTQLKKMRLLSAALQTASENSSGKKCWDVNFGRFNCCRAEVFVVWVFPFSVPPQQQEVTQHKTFIISVISVCSKDKSLSEELFQVC